MGVLVYVLGRSGTGKSYSMRNFPKNDLALINVQGKILPFRGAAEIETKNTDNSDAVVKAIGSYAETYKSIVVDDFQYLMANEFMRRAYEKGFDKFTEIGRHAWDIADKVRELPQDVIVYVMCHTDTDAEGTERLKTIGKLLDEKIFLEGMSTIVLKTMVSDGNYTFVTQNNGKDTVKSPADMFPSYAVDNDLYYVDQKIREYYGLGNKMTKEDLKAADADVAHEEIQKPERKRRPRREKEVETSETKNDDEALAKLAEIPEGQKGDVPFFGENEVKEEPTRKRRTKTNESEIPQSDAETRSDQLDDADPEKNISESENESETRPKRRRKRV